MRGALLDQWNGHIGVYGNVAEMSLAGVEIVDQAAARRLLTGSGPWQCSVELVVLLHIQRLRVRSPGLPATCANAGVTDRRPKSTRRQRGEDGRFMASSPMLEPEDERSLRRRLGRNVGNGRAPCCRSDWGLSVFDPHPERLLSGGLDRLVF